MTKFSSVDSIFENAKDMDGLRGWLMRAYFNTQKHGEMTYFSREVSKENVLEYVSKPTNQFPQTPYAIVGMWNLLPSLREGLRSVPDDAQEDEKEDVYTKGNETLATIGKAIGDVTPTMVNKISAQATTKLSALLLALNSKNPWLAREADEKMENACLTVAEAYAEAIQNSDISGEVLEKVAGMGLLPLQDAFTADDIELGALQDVIDIAKDGADFSEIEDIILEDLKRLDNVFLTAQLAVSRQVFPPAKRGRPKKNSQKVVPEDDIYEG